MSVDRAWTPMRKHQVFTDYGLVLLAAEFTFKKTNYIKVWKQRCSHSAQSWEIVLVFLFFSFLLQHTSQAAAAAFQGPARTAPQLPWLLFVANTILVYSPSVIHALSFQSLVIALKHVRPIFNGGRLKQGQILNLHPLPSSCFSKHYGLLP